MPMIEVSEAEHEQLQRGRAIRGWLAALDKGDRSEEARLAAKISPSAEVLMRAKRAFGAERVKALPFDLRRGEEAYGPGWLDE